MPDGVGLAGLLSDKFLGGSEKDRPLSIVADYAIDASDLVTVQGFIRDIFVQFSPAPFHSKVPEFRWSAIVTTNYDQLMESAFGEHKRPLQKLSPIVKTTDKMEEILRT